MIINESGIYAVAPNGMMSYGQPVETQISSALLNLRLFTDFNLAQLLVLVLTTCLAGLVLLGRIEWIQRLQF
jgi:hypothetical protein